MKSLLIAALAATGLVTLAPGGVANALLRIAHAAGYPAAKCAPVTAHWLIPARSSRRSSVS